MHYAASQSRAKCSRSRADSAARRGAGTVFGQLQADAQLLFQQPLRAWKSECESGLPWQVASL